MGVTVPILIEAMERHGTVDHDEGVVDHLEVEGVKLRSGFQEPGRRAPASAPSKNREHVATNARCGSKNQSKSGVSKPHQIFGRLGEEP